MPIFVDTNVLVFARDATEPVKQACAAGWMRHLWETQEGRASIQVLEEYYVTTTRELEPGLTSEQARADVTDLLAWGPLSIDGEVLEAAWSIEDRFELSFWDALIVASAHRAGCRHLLTEDLQHDADLDGVRVVDSFRVPAGPLE